MTSDKGTNITLVAYYYFKELRKNKAALKPSAMPSTVIASYTYDAASEILHIIFISGLVYNYKQVPEAIYKEMKAAKRKGIFFNKKIKGKFDFEKIGTT